ncbi:hypothetical protein [Calycomorphotria hydatis]|uniref:Uncharacterized protein n=1 Tax=Calycomorphotria hydatis TaxID=2528027 RepID=A0A517TDM6_9PLAN|nr:hypothetical protein [Calycomorphotria hydatis]QDT66476.1 hypothetical protein V22_37440 [Calycomorphotria hydatis]
MTSDHENTPCEPCGLPEEPKPTLEADGDELIEELQLAIFAPVRDKPMQDFLDYIENDLPQLIINSVGDNRIWVEFDDGGSVLGCRSLKIGSSNLPNQSRTHKHGRFDYRYETRSARSVAYIDFCHPSINDIWSDVKTCAILAAVASVVAAALAKNYGAAKAVFYPAFIACLTAKIGERLAREVSVGFHTDNEHGCWSNHCS